VVISRTDLTVGPRLITIRASTALKPRSKRLVF